MTTGFESVIAKREAFEEFRRVIDGFLNGGEHVLVLSNYEAANLRALFDAIQTHDGLGNPLRVLDTGDWLGQLRFRLPLIDDKHLPNVTVADQLKAVRRECAK